MTRVKIPRPPRVPSQPRDLAGCLSSLLSDNDPCQGLKCLCFQAEEKERRENLEKIMEENQRKIEEQNKKMVRNFDRLLESEAI